MDKPFQKMAVVGTGFLGSQIAMLSAFSGYKVCIYDIREGAFDQTYDRLFKDFKAKGINPVIPWGKWAAVKKSISFTTDLAKAVQDVDLVVEAVTEDVNIKRKVFRDVGKLAPAKTIIATNSSSMPVSKMEKSSGRPERCLNTHFYLPLQGMYMVDLMGGTKTLPEVMQKGDEWIRSLNCLPLRVNKEILGFCFNNVWRAVKKQVLFMWGNGYADLRDIDRAWRIFTGTKFGPFGLMDTVGLDVIYDIEMSYYKDSRDPKDKPPKALLDKIKRGELGVKSGKGFYTYPNPEYLDPNFLNPNK